MGEPHYTKSDGWTRERMQLAAALKRSGLDHLARGGAHVGGRVAPMQPRAGAQLHSENRTGPSATGGSLVNYRDRRRRLTAMAHDHLEAEIDQTRKATMWFIAMVWIIAVVGAVLMLAGAGVLLFVVLGWLGL